MASFSVKPGLGGTEMERLRVSIREMEKELADKRARLAEIGGAAEKAPKGKQQTAGKEQAGEKQQAAGKEAAAAKPKEQAAPAPRDERFRLLRSVGEECQEDEELAVLLSKKQTGIRFYDGFEPSGRMHIAQGVLKTINVNKCTAVGGTFVFWVADWFALMNDKMGGSLAKIQKVGEYLIEVWTAAGMNLENVQFIWSSQEINKKADQYWTQMLDIARVFSLARIMKCCQIMGRSEGTLSCAQILYPLMQCTDVFFLRADVCQLGVDQRKVNMLARDYCSAAGKKQKPVILSHHMMYGLLEGQAKMSKSDPNSAIYMEDTAEEVERKFSLAWCPVDKENVAKNPLLDYLRSIVFTEPGKSIELSGKKYESTEQVSDALVAGDVKPDDLRAVITALTNKYLEPVRKHFEEDPKAKEILALVRQYKREAAEDSEKKPDPSKLNPSTVLIPILPSARLSLNAPLKTAVAVRKFLKEGKKVRVLLQDWTGYALNTFEGNWKSVKTALQYFSAWLNACLTEEERKNVEIVMQSDVILAAPDKYWIAVINFGRDTKVSDLGKALGRDFSTGEGEQASWVISSLMLMEDIAVSQAGLVVPPLKLYDGVAAMAGARCVEAADVVPCMKDGMLDLEASTDGKFPETAKASIVFCDEVEAIFTPKVKKAFCTPAVSEGNPVVALGVALSEYVGKPLSIPQKEQNELSVEPKDLSALYASGSIHPGDLKAAVQTLLKSVVADLRATLSKDSAFKTLETQIANINKQMAKKAK
ncbi:hypothetical protein DIPPA_28314 [Diplonema papillatum]|nr:hypothetical protein DIPPA_28314 [Diplonema papillatum]